MLDKDKFAEELAEQIVDLLVQMEKDANIPILPLNYIHLERAMMSLQDSRFVLKYRVSHSHGYSIEFEFLPEDECVQGAIGVFVLRVLYKDPVSNDFLLAADKRVYLFPSQVTEVIKEESISLLERSPTYYKLLNESQFDKWN